MSNLVVINNQEVSFEVVGDQAFTTSIDIANVFEKRHDNIIAQIRALPSDNFNALNFKAVEYEDQKGELRPCYNLTKDGFSLLVMGFTGERAYRWKIEFLKAFNKMATMLKSKELTNPPRLDNLIKSISKLNLKLNELDSKNKALASDLIIAKDKYTSLLEKQVSFLENRALDEPEKAKRFKTGVGIKFRKAELDKAIELFKQGLSFSDIARELGRAPWTINRHLKMAGVR